MPQLGSRGVLAGATRRNGFIAASTNINFNDAFDTERVEVVKGANAMLFGASAAGGFVNTSSKQARFGTDDRPTPRSTCPACGRMPPGF